jgi:hypothetical protein
MVVQENWWSPPNEYRNTQDDWFISFFEEGCKHFHDADATRIWVYTIFGQQRFPDEHQMRDNVNFLFIGENMTVHTNHPLYERMDAVLNFFHDTPKSIRFPLWMIYWNFYRDGLFDTFHERQEYDESRHDKAILVVSHDNNGVRQQICSKVMSAYNIRVDSNYENVPHDTLVDIPRDGTQHKISLLKSYRYNICAENSHHAGYVTEKIFEAFYSGCVPIYWGSSPVEPQIIHQDSFIHIFCDDMPKDAREISKTPVWKDDALVYIFAAHLKIWSVVYKKMKMKCLRNLCTLRIYDVKNVDECYDLLAGHWKTYRKLWNPRPHFNLVEDGTENVVRTIFMEDLADEMYDRFKTMY